MVSSFFYRLFFLLSLQFLLVLDIKCIPEWVIAIFDWLKWPKNKVLPSESLVSLPRTLHDLTTTLPAVNFNCLQLTGTNVCLNLRPQTPQSPDQRFIVKLKGRSLCQK